MNMRFKLLIMLGLLSVVAAPLQADQVPSKADKVRDAQRHDKTPQGYLGPSVIKPKNDAKQAQQSSRVVQGVNPDMRAMPKKPTLERVGDQLTPPIITDPAGGYICCASNGSQGEEVNANFEVSGEGLPGHTIRVRAALDNSGNITQIKNTRTTVADDGHWKVRGFSLQMSGVWTNSAVIEVNATQYFDATEVRQPNGEAHAEPVYLRFRTPKRRPMGQAATSTGE